jgi:hypothetical protein
VAEPPANARASVRTTTTNLRDRLRESASPPSIPAAAAAAEPSIGPGKLRRTKEASAEAPQLARPEVSKSPPPHWCACACAVPNISATFSRRR